MEDEPIFAAFSEYLNFTEKKFRPRNEMSKYCKLCNLKQKLEYIIVNLKKFRFNFLNKFRVNSSIVQYCAQIEGAMGATLNDGSVAIFCIPTSCRSKVAILTCSAKSKVLLIKCCDELFF